MGFMGLIDPLPLYTQLSFPLHCTCNYRFCYFSIKRIWKNIVQTCARINKMKNKISSFLLSLLSSLCPNPYFFIKSPSTIKLITLLAIWTSITCILIILFQELLPWLGHIFLTIKDRAFILRMCIPCDKTFHMVP